MLSEQKLSKKRKGKYEATQKRRLLLESEEEESSKPSESDKESSSVRMDFNFTFVLLGW